ncbi:hypothetical protein [uncultured Alsobacter sp.]|uniref:hypothetical protein n=1 Tax=uncultured Alsobacter sp. TaxID=1748258 RepID=UPI0025FE5288|nr:hypothetical protein [uncultured Alsobacter sp.]
MVDGSLAAKVIVAALLGAFASESVARQTCDGARAEARRHLAQAEESRDWVELWRGLDDREAAAELGFFEDHLRHAEKALDDADCTALESGEILGPRLRHEAVWLERTRRVLGRPAPFADASLKRPGR